jgi:hypothetical protein
MRANFIKKKYSAEVINNGNKLLMKTCRKAIERSGYTEGPYKNVKCSFKSAKKFFESVKSHKKLYEVWLDITKKHLESGKEYSLRPTFDRIDEQGHYYINNLQILTFGQNASKARRKK